MRSTAPMWLSTWPDGASTGRYHTRHRQEFKQSRVGTTHLVGEAIAAANRPPRVWLQASTATVYIHRYDAPNDEATGILGKPPR